MANIDNAFGVDAISFNDELGIFYGSVDPRTGLGFSAPVGSIFLFNGADPKFFSKYGVNDVDWRVAKASDILFDDTFAGLGYTTVQEVLDHLVDINQAMSEPTGFPNRDDSTISFDDGTRTLTIAPVGASFSVYGKGQKFTFTTAQQATINDTEGTHYIYFDLTGVINILDTFDPRLISEWIYIANVYWDATNKISIIFGEERHGLTMDGTTHTYLHTINGAQYISGLALGDITVDGTGDLATDATISCSNGSIRDEDIVHTITSGAPQVLTTPAQIPVYYRDGANGYWRIKNADNYPLIYSGTAGYTGANGRLPFNEFTGTIWKLTEVGNGGMVMIHILATNDPRHHIVAIQGEKEYSTITSARDGVQSELTNLAGLPFQETVAIGSIIYQSATAYANTPKARIRSTDTGDTYFDWRKKLFFAGGSTVGDHGSLAGLSDDDHLQYHTDARGDARYFTKATYQYVEDDTESTTTSTTFVNKLTMTTANLPLGNYRLAWYVEAKNLIGAPESTEVHIYEFGGADLIQHSHFSTIYEEDMGFKVYTGISGVHTFMIDYRANLSTAYVMHARFELIRVD